MQRVILGGLLSLACVAPAFAQEVKCPSPAVPLAAEFAPWSTREPLAPGNLAKRMEAATIVVGRGYDVALRPTRTIRYADPPEKPGSAESHGGLFAFDARIAGTYRVALGAAAWIDVAAGGRLIASTGHGHGPACSGIRKLVEFPLKAGRHLLQISGSDATDLALMITRLP